MIDKFQYLFNEADGDGGDGGGGSLLTGGGEGAGEASGAATGGTGDGTGVTQGDTFDFRTLVGDDGNFVDGWTDKLPEEMRDHANHYQKYRNPIQALENTRSLQQLLGKKGDAVVIPGPDSDEETQRAFREKMGIPEQAGDYDIRKPDDLPENFDWSDDRINGFKDLAHEIGLTPQQVEKLVQYDTAQTISMNESADGQMVDREQQIFEQESQKLRQAWGEDFKTNQAMAERAALTAGFNDEQIKENPLFRNADFVITMAKLGKLMSEDTLAKGGDNGNMVSAKSKANDIITNTNNPYYKRYWAGDEEVVGMVSNMLSKG